MKWLLIFLISPCMAFAESIRGVVINVIDGDTVILLEKTPEQMRTHRIRLEGIDAPERGQDGYEGAKKYLEKLIWGETVTVRYTENDRYGPYFRGNMAWKNVRQRRDGEGRMGVDL